MNDAVFEFVVVLYYQYYPGGNNLFPMLHDGHVSDERIEYCLRQADREKDVMGVFICNQMLKKTLSKRRDIWRAVWNHNHV